MKPRKNNHKEDFSNVCAAVINRAISFYLILLVMAFPLIFHHSYVDILPTKYRFYYVTVLSMLLTVAVLALMMLVVDLMEYHGRHAIRLFQKLHPKNWKQVFCAADFAVIAFWLACLISTCQSDYFQMDILHFRGKIKPEQSDLFTSTLGNINTYTAYVAMVLGNSSSLYMVETKWRKVVWYYFCMLIGFFAIIMGRSDNACLALGGLFVVLPFFVFKSPMGIRRYFLMLASFGTVVQGIALINQACAETVIGLDGFFHYFDGFPGLIYVVIGLWVLFFVISVLSKNGKNFPGKVPVERIWGGLLAFGMVLICFLLYDVNIAGNMGKYGGLERYLVFDDHWGTNRGYIWRKSIEIFRDFPLRHKLFGYGPETFGILTTEKFLYDMIASTQGQIFDNAHNEYLQYLVTIGILGFIPYLTFLAASEWHMIKNGKGQGVVLGCAAAAFCYHMQAFVNLNLPITAPVMWLFLSVGMAAARKEGL